MPELYDSHSVFLNSSFVDNQPLSVLEAMASGMPVVSSRHCDIPEIVKDGVTGFLAPERDVDGLYDALRRVVQEPENWNRLKRVDRTS